MPWGTYGTAAVAAALLATAGLRLARFAILKLRAQAAGLPDPKDFMGLATTCAGPWAASGILLANAYAIGAEWAAHAALGVACLASALMIAWMRMPKLNVKGWASTPIRKAAVATVLLGGLAVGAITNPGVSIFALWGSYAMMGTAMWAHNHLALAVGTALFVGAATYAYTQSDDALVTPLSP
jgi:hypothetical protein